VPSDFNFFFLPKSDPTFLMIIRLVIVVDRWVPNSHITTIRPV
jgi:hypothetical protein